MKESELREMIQKELKEAFVSTGMSEESARKYIKDRLKQVGILLFRAEGYLNEAKVHINNKTLGFEGKRAIQHILADLSKVKKQVDDLKKL